MENFSSNFNSSSDPVRNDGNTLQGRERLDGSQQQSVRSTHTPDNGGAPAGQNAGTAALTAFGARLRANPYLAVGQDGMPRRASDPRARSATSLARATGVAGAYSTPAELARERARRLETQQAPAVEVPTREPPVSGSHLSRELALTPVSPQQFVISPVNQTLSMRGSAVVGASSAYLPFDVNVAQYFLGYTTRFVLSGYKISTGGSVGTLITAIATNPSATTSTIGASTTSVIMNDADGLLVPCRAITSTYISYSGEAYFTFPENANAFGLYFTVFNSTGDIVNYNIDLYTGPQIANVVYNSAVTVTQVDTTAVLPVSIDQSTPVWVTNYREPAPVFAAQAIVSPSTTGVSDAFVMQVGGSMHGSTVGRSRPTGVLSAIVSGVTMYFSTYDNPAGVYQVLLTTRTNLPDLSQPFEIDQQDLFYRMFFGLTSQQTNFVIDAASVPALNFRNTPVSLRSLSLVVYSNSAVSSTFGYSWTVMLDDVTYDPTSPSMSPSMVERANAAAHALNGNSRSIRARPSKKNEPAGPTIEDMPLPLSVNSFDALLPAEPTRPAQATDAEPTPAWQTPLTVGLFQGQLGNYTGRGYTGGQNRGVATADTLRSHFEAPHIGKLDQVSKYHDLGTYVVRSPQEFAVLNDWANRSWREAGPLGLAVANIYSMADAAGLAVKFQEYERSLADEARRLAEELATTEGIRLWWEEAHAFANTSPNPAVAERIERVVNGGAHNKELYQSHVNVPEQEQIDFVITLEWTVPKRTRDRANAVRGYHERERRRLEAASTGDKGVENGPAPSHDKTTSNSPQSGTPKPTGNRSSDSTSGNRARNDTDKQDEYSDTGSALPLEFVFKDVTMGEVEESLYKSICEVTPGNNIVSDRFLEWLNKDREGGDKLTQFPDEENLTTENILRAVTNVLSVYCLTFMPIPYSSDAIIAHSRCININKLMHALNGNIDTGELVKIKFEGKKVPKYPDLDDWFSKINTYPTFNPGPVNFSATNVFSSLFSDYQGSLVASRIPDNAEGVRHRCPFSFLGRVGGGIPNITVSFSGVVSHEVVATPDGEHYIQSWTEKTAQSTTAKDVVRVYNITGASFSTWIANFWKSMVSRGSNLIDLYFNVQCWMSKIAMLGMTPADYKTITPFSWELNAVTTATQPENIWPIVRFVTLEVAWAIIAGGNATDYWIYVDTFFNSRNGVVHAPCNDPLYQMLLLLHCPHNYVSLRFTNANNDDYRWFFDGVATQAPGVVYIVCNRAMTNDAGDELNFWTPAADNSYPVPQILALRGFMNFANEAAVLASLANKSDQLYTALNYLFGIFQGNFRDWYYAASYFKYATASFGERVSKTVVPGALVGDQNVFLQALNPRLAEMRGPMGLFYGDVIRDVAVADNAAAVINLNIPMVDRRVLTVHWLGTHKFKTDDDFPEYPFVGYQSSSWKWSPMAQGLYHYAMHTVGLQHAAQRTGATPDLFVRVPVVDSSYSAYWMVAPSTNTSATGPAHLIDTIVDKLSGWKTFPARAVFTHSTRPCYAYHFFTQYDLQSIAGWEDAPVPFAPPAAVGQGGTGYKYLRPDRNNWFVGTNFFSLFGVVSSEIRESPYVDTIKCCSLHPYDGFPVDGSAWVTRDMAGAVVQSPQLFCSGEVGYQEFAAQVFGSLNALAFLTFVNNDGSSSLISPNKAGGAWVEDSPSLPVYGAYTASTNPTFLPSQAARLPLNSLLAEFNDGGTTADGKKPPPDPNASEYKSDLMQGFSEGTANQPAGGAAKVREAAQ